MPPTAVDSVKKDGSRRWRWAIWIAAICLVLGGVIAFSQRSSKPASGAQSTAKSGKAGRGAGAIPVAVAKVQQGNMGEYISALGTVTPVYTATITSRVAGTLEQIHYREGQMVHKGELLAVIDPRPYQASYTQAQGALERDQALLANARLDLQRYQSAFSQHAVPEQTVATQQAAVNGDLGTVKLDEGNLQAAKVNLDYARITAPIDGRVGLRAVDPGNIVQANGTTPLLVITQMEPITVIFTMAEDYISDVITQMRAGHALHVTALSRDNETELAQGTLLTIDNQVDTNTGTVRARARFANRDARLFPNEFVNAKLLVKTLMGVNIIPNAAIQRNNEVAFVYIVNPDKTVHSRNIKVATNNADQSAVTGVKPGEVLVIDGFDKLQDGIRVAVRSPSPAPASGAGNQMNQAQENTQAPTQGAAGKQLNTASQNPQQPQKGHGK